MYCLFLYSLLACTVLADLSQSNYPKCSLTDTKGSLCWMYTSNLHPTQFSYGPLQVAAERKVVTSFKRANQLYAFQQMYNVPVIIGRNHFYLTDKHHHVAGLDTANVDESEKFVYVEIIDNLQQLSDDKFWKEMVENDKVWLHSATGMNPLDPLLLPNSISEMEEDNFRDIAYQLQVNGGYEKDATLYQQFYWADYLRKYIKLPHRTDWTNNYQKEICVVRPYDINCFPDDFNLKVWSLSSEVENSAKYLAFHEEARYLPGFISVLHTERLIPVS